MKYLFVLLFPILLGAQENTIVQDNLQWYINYSDAVSESNKVKKNILVYFTGSDWCAPCKKLKKDLFLTDAFKTLSRDYVLLYVDIPMNKGLLSAEQMAHNKGLLPKLNKKGVFPLLKVLNSEEKELDELSGYSMNGKIGQHLELLKKHRG